jgi:protein-S-isoprenylcysteine O-methyltransferase Ste14
MGPARSAVKLAEPACAWPAEAGESAASAPAAGTSDAHGGRGPDRIAVIDIVSRLALGLSFAGVAGAYLSNAVVLARQVELPHADPVRLVDLLSVGAISLFTLLVAWLFLIRLRPVRKSEGIWPRAAAILGGFLTFGLLLLPRHVDLPLAAKLVSSGVVLIGNGLAVAILIRLGRSFSILPEARRLVTEGPYGMVRHPLYLAEAIGTLGLLIQFLSPLAVMLVAAQLAFQLLRIQYEERVLREAFPEYEAYSRRTARLIPGVY